MLAPRIADMSAVRVTVPPSPRARPELTVKVRFDEPSAIDTVDGPRLGELQPGVGLPVPGRHHRRDLHREDSTGNTRTSTFDVVVTRRH